MAPRPRKAAGAPRGQHACVPGEAASVVTAWESLGLGCRQMVLYIRRLGVGSTLSLMAHRILATSVVSYRVRVLPTRDWCDLEESFPRGPKVWPLSTWCVSAPSECKPPPRVTSFGVVHQAMLFRAAAYEMYCVTLGGRHWV